jgi:hypothetical protein
MEGMIMERSEALQEFKKMWTWLYKHPAHDSKYYVKHVAKPEQGWKNDCPLCALSDGECKECNALWDQGNGSLCSDPESPFSQWRKTHLNDPNFRTWYAGKIVDLADQVIKK